MQRNSPYYNPSNLLQLLQFTRTANQIAHSDKLLPCYATSVRKSHRYNYQTKILPAVNARSVYNATFEIVFHPVKIQHWNYFHSDLSPK